GKPMLVMCEHQNSMDAVHQPTTSLLVDRASRFWSKPRNRNSSGQAVKKRIASAKSGSVRQSCQRGSKWKKCKAVGKGIAMAPKAAKLPKMYSHQRGPQPML